MELLQRGVWVAPFLSSAGIPIALAVTSDHRFVGFLTFQDEAEERVVKRTLWTMLNEADPVPLLKAV